MRLGTLVFVAIALLAVGVGIFLWQPGAGSGPSAATYSFQDWFVRCQDVKGATACGMSQQLVDKNIGRAVLQLSLGETANGGHVLGVVVPLGVSVPDGVTLQVADLTRKFEYTQCLPGGCIASLSADADLISKMKATADGKLAVIDRLGKPVVMPVSLKGFGPAFDKMHAKGGGWLSFLGQ